MTILGVLDYILFFVLLIPGIYFLTFAFASGFVPFRPRRKRTDNKRVIILIPAYKADEVIFNTARAAVTQDYPADYLRVQVISDGMSDETIEQLGKIPVEVLPVSFENSSKAKALARAVDCLGPDAADIVIILDADNLIGRTFVSKVVDAFEDGAVAAQAHRKAKNRNSSTAVLDAASEEINNSVFRAGHLVMGLPSALIGSGMVFSYAWFNDHIGRCITSGEDKELELMLLEEGVFIDYLDDVYLFDEKTSSARGYYNQRRRWIAAQFNCAMTAFRHLPAAIRNRNYGLIDKLVQWLFPPRMVLAAVPVLMTVFFAILGSTRCAKWFLLMCMLIISFVAALPGKHWDRKLVKALLIAPLLAIMSFMNLFRLRGMRDRFIHTEHIR